MALRIDSFEVDVTVRQRRPAQHDDSPGRAGDGLPLGPITAANVPGTGNGDSGVPGAAVTSSKTPIASRVLARTEPPTPLTPAVPAPAPEVTDGMLRFISPPIEAPSPKPLPTAVTPAAVQAGNGDRLKPLFKRLAPLARTTPPDAERLARTGGTGRALDEATRKQMEGFFGADLGDVRVHADTQAAQAAASQGAQAFTIGRDIYFGQGKFDLSSQKGKALLGHELTHVLQQRTIDPRRQGMTAGSVEALETEAQARSQRFEMGATEVKGTGFLVNRYLCTYSVNRPATDNEIQRLEAIARGALKVCEETLGARHPDLLEGAARTLETVEVDIDTSLAGHSDEDIIQLWGRRMAAAVAAKLSNQSTPTLAAAAGSVLKQPVKGTGQQPAKTNITVTTQTFDIEADDLDGAAAALQSLDEWGKTRWNVTYDYDATDGVATSVTVTARITVELPRWTMLSKQPRRVQAEWNRMLTALRRHENEHVRIARERIQQLAGELLKKPESDLPDIHSRCLQDLDTLSEAYDTRTAHGQTEGVTLDLNVAGQPSAKTSSDADAAEDQARAAEAVMAAGTTQSIEIHPMNLTSIQRSPSDDAAAIKQKLKEEIDKAFEARDKWKAAGNVGQAIYSERLGLLLGRKSGDQFASMKDVDEFIAESDKAALTELDTMAKVGLDKVDLFPHVFPLTWAARIRDALRLDVDIDALRKRRDEDQKYTESLGKRLPGSLLWSGLARTYEEALKGEAPFNLELRHAEWQKSHASRDFALGWIEYARSEAQVFFCDAWDKLVQGVSDDIESGKLVIDNTRQAEYREFVANKRAALIALPALIRAWGPGREEPFTNVVQIAFATAFASSVLSQLTFVPIWIKAKTEHAAKVGETDGVIGSLDSGGRVFQAILWAYEGDYFGEAAKPVAEALKAAGPVMVAQMAIAAAIGAISEVLLIPLDLYFLSEGIKGADAAIKSIREAFASAGKATTMVDLQRASANIAAATVGQGASLMLSLLSIISSVASLKGKIAKIKEKNPGISNEDALNKALEDSPKEARLKALASRAQIRQKMNLRDAASWQRGRYTDRPAAGVDRVLLDKACDIRAAEGATLENFTKYNVAVARVRVNGKIVYLDSANTPGGLHSEDWILVQVHQLRMGGGSYRNRADVVLEALYTERVPCGACSNKLRQNFSEADVFYTVLGKDGESSKGVNLMKKYGLEVPEPAGPKKSLPVIPPPPRDEDKR